MIQISLNYRGPRDMGFAKNNVCAAVFAAEMGLELPHYFLCQAGGTCEGEVRAATFVWVSLAGSCVVSRSVRLGSYTYELHDFADEKLVSSLISKQVFVCLVASAPPLPPLAALTPAFPRQIPGNQGIQVRTSD